MSVLGLQGLDESVEESRAPSSNSWVFCFSAASIFAC
jgi:hypothetical protein